MKSTGEKGSEENLAGEKGVEGLHPDGDEKNPGTADSPPGEENKKSSGDPAAEEGKPVSAEEKIAFLESKLAEANDQFLRKAADFENFRKRMIRERQEAVDYANQALLLDLIEIMDDFDRAIKAAESCVKEGDEKASAAMLKTFHEGVTMIEKRLSTQLENKWGLKRFAAEGQPFDPNRHEALMMEKSADVSEPLVQEEFYTGYTLKDRVVRNAKVKVLMPET